MKSIHSTYKFHPTSFSAARIHGKLLDMRLILLFSILISPTVWAGKIVNATAMPLENFEYIDEVEFEAKVEESSKPVVFFLSDASCLWTSFPARSCFLVEKKVDFFGKQIKARGWKLIGLDVSFRNLELARRYSAVYKPTVLIFYKGQMIEKIEPRFKSEERSPYVISWQDDMAKRVLNLIERFH
jgi:hypothetical protein